MNIEQGLAIVLAAVITCIASVWASRRSARNERIRMSQEMVTILGTERQKLAEDLQRVKLEAGELAKVRDAQAAENLEIKEQMSLLRIEHRQTIAEKDATIRERSAECKEVQAQLDQSSRQLTEVKDELKRTRELLDETKELVYRQARILSRSPNRAEILRSDPDLLRGEHQD